MKTTLIAQNKPSCREQEAIQTAKAGLVWAGHQARLSVQDYAQRHDKLMSP
ncbi:hypothetical protein DPMN_100005 [Dreissena polymorpha]|uniref:Uncharacterized protein n=1 Tax=Dreissena polymorpha TaxID=45954 RepID=A0A9D4R7T0_DREPO|nr:hypothetical protein DPMN_100005 [Dreissena polymorpha]